MLICAKIYNMEQFPQNDHDPILFSQIPDVARERLEDPEQISESIDGLMKTLATPEALQGALNATIERHAELYNKSLLLRDKGESLPRGEQVELDDISSVILGLQWIDDNYLKRK